MKNYMKMLLTVLRQDADRRRSSPHGYTAYGASIAQDSDKHLATLMQNVEDAKRALDDYVVSLPVK